MKKVLFSILVYVSVSVFCVAQTLEDYNRQLNVFKEDFKIKSDGELLKADSKRPINLPTYLEQMGLEKDIINTVTHVEVYSKSDLNLINVYAVQYSKDDYSKYLMVIEDAKALENYILINCSFDFKNNTVSVYKTAKGKSKWSDCFGSCVEKGLSAHTTIGRVIIGMGVAAGFGCVACGAVAATYTSVILLGCAGGCNK
ncbi:MAG: hypothetical protein DI548_00565 [Flavobacterium johnsoniae]|nr:MAG: hypothetical protein DI548_00565 [Flavobacterium johnsoniae]